MSLLVLTDSLVLVNGADLSGHSNKVSVDASVEDLDATTFASGGWRERHGGLGSHEWALGGFWEAGDDAKPDDRLWADLGTDAAWTVAVAAAEGSVAYLGNVLSAQFKFGGDVGALAPYEGKGRGSGLLTRGALLAGPGTARTSDGQSTGVQLGAVSATQVMRAALHVCSASGTTPSVTVKLQSAATQGGSYTDRITFSAATGLTSELASVAGSISHTWWRAQWTITGTDPSFLLALAAGVANA